MAFKWRSKTKSDKLRLNLYYTILEEISIGLASKKKKLQKEGSWFKESTCKLKSKAKFNSQIQFDSNESKLIPRNLNHGPCLIEPKSNYLHFAIIKKKLKLQIGGRLLITNLLGFAFYNQSFPFLYISIHCKWHSHHKSPCVKKILFDYLWGNIPRIFWNILEKVFEKIFNLK
jgi:hypothetical protein